MTISQMMYLVSREGPEWNNPFGVWKTKKAAKKAAKRYESKLNVSDDVFDGMSHVRITRIPYYDE